VSSKHSKAGAGFPSFECISTAAGEPSKNGGRCEVPLFSGALERDLLFLRKVLLKKHQRIDFDDRVKFGLLVLVTGFNAFLALDNR